MAMAVPLSTPPQSPGMILLKSRSDFHFTSLILLISLICLVFLSFNVGESRRFLRNQQPVSDVWAKRVHWVQDAGKWRHVRENGFAWSSWRRREGFSWPVEESCDCLRRSTQGSHTRLHRPYIPNHNWTYLQMLWDLKHHHSHVRWCS